MKKQKTLLSMVLTLALSFIITGTVYAAPQKMSDGVTFDPQYYADTYPDVVKVYGTSVDKLYQHYKEYGKSEGRKATADSKVEAKQSTASTDADKAVAKMRKTYKNGSTWDSNIREPIAYTDNGVTYSENLAWREALIAKMYKAILGEKDSYVLNKSTDVNTIKPYDYVWTYVDYSENAAWLKVDKPVVPDDMMFVLSVDYDNRTFTGVVIRDWKVLWDVPYSFDEVKMVLNFQ